MTGLLLLAGVIGPSSIHGELIFTALESKRKDKAMKSILFARGALEAAIKDLESKKEKNEFTSD